MKDTFLIERSMGVLCYLLVVGITYLLLKDTKSYTKFKHRLNACTIILCVMAAFYVPAKTHDLTRIWSIVSQWENISFVKWADTYLVNSKAPGAYLLYYVVAQIKLPRLLPVIACFTFFSTIFYVLKSESRLERSTNQSLAIAFLYIMCQGLFLGVISGIRSDIAFSLVLRAIYNDLCLKKRTVRNYVLCVIAITFHQSAILVVGVYLLFSFKSAWKNSRAFYKLLYVLTFGAGCVWTIKAQASLLEQAMGTARGYMSGKVYSYVWEYIIVGIAFLLLCEIVLLYKTHENDPTLNENCQILIVLVLAVCLMFRSYTMFHRYANFAMYVSMPIVASLFDRMYENGERKKILMFKLSCIVILLLACARGDLCGYKFMVL